jgi:hypothetical protein
MALVAGAMCHPVLAHNPLQTKRELCGYTSPVVRLSATRQAQKVELHLDWSPVSRRRQPIPTSSGWHSLKEGQGEQN